MSAPHKDTYPFSLSREGLERPLSAQIKGLEP
jgi:hypothetical protein